MATDIAIREPGSLMPVGAEWEALKEQAGILVKSGLLPQSVNTPEKAIAIALKGRELGIGPWQALSHINVIQGKPTASSELMLALAYSRIPGFRAEPVEDSDEAFAIKLTRPGQQSYVARFTVQEAKRAGLLGKDSWGKYPRAMLRARAISAGLRLIAPDAIMGLSYTPEELGAEVDGEGEVVFTPDAPEPEPTRRKQQGNRQFAPPQGADEPADWKEPPADDEATEAAPYLVCEECGLVMAQHPEQTIDAGQGHTMTAGAFGVKSRQLFRRVLCVACGKAEKAAAGRCPSGRREEATDGGSERS